MLGGERINKFALSRQYNCCWITIDRRLYNSNVSLYNEMLVVFPSSLIANSKGFKKKEFFETDEVKREDVKIDL